MEGETTIEKLHGGNDIHREITWRETTIGKLHGGRDIHREMKKRRVKATVDEIKRIKRDYF